MRILINRTDAIGDTILTLPMLKMLKQSFPDAEVAFVISPCSQDLFLGRKILAKTYVLKAESFFKTWTEAFDIIRDFRPTHYFYVGGSHLLSMAAFFSNVRFRGGLLSRWPSFLWLNKGVRQKRSYVEMHEAEYNLNLLAPLGLSYNYLDYEKYRPHFFLDPNLVQQHTEEFAQELRQRGKDFSWEKNIIFIHPGMSGHTLNWPSRNYGRLITYLNRMMPGDNFYIISFTASDEQYISVVRDELEEGFRTSDLFQSVYFFDGGPKGLRYFMHQLSKADVFVGPSTGTTHIANILGVKTFGLYSPLKVQSALRWRPYDRSITTIITPDVVCGESSKCILRECPYYECMSKIEAKEVATSVVNYLKKERKRDE